MAHRINFNDYLYLQGHNVQITGTEGLRVPMGNASQRPIIMQGIVRYNPDEDQYELGTENDIIVLNNRNDGTVWYSKKGGDLDGSLVIKNHRILNNVGSASEPSYSFYYYNNTGLYSPSSNNISVILEGDKNITPIIEMVRDDNTDFGQTFTINGDLVVNGEQKVKDTSDIKFQDNRITLNHEGPASGKSGIDIEGDGTIQATIHYDYSLSKWSIDGSNITNSAQPDSDSDLTNKIYVDTLTDNISQDLTDHINNDTAHPQYLRRDDNLSTVDSVQLSRDNLSVYSQTEVDTLINDSVDGALYESNLQQNGGTLPQTNRTNDWTQPQQFGNYHLGLGVNSSEGIGIRSTTDPVDGDNILSVESSGTNTHFGVTNNFGTWAKDGLRIGNQYNSSMSDAQGGVIIGAPSGDTQGEGTINAELIYRNGEELDTRYYTQSEIDTQLNNIESSAQQDLTDHINDDTAHPQYLRKDNALGGLADIPGARTTLDVYSTGEADNLLDQKIDVSEKASANGVATLDSNTKIPTNQLPALAITNTFTVASITERDNLVSNENVQEGDVAIVTDDGNGLTRSYILDSTHTWQEINTPGDVYSVNGYTGNVSLDYSDVNADQQGTAQSIMDTHESATDPHTQYLRKDNALAGLTDIPGARTTLDVYSTDEVDSELSNNALYYYGTQLTDSDDLDDLNTDSDVGTYWWVDGGIPINAPDNANYGVLYIVRDGNQIYQLVLGDANGSVMALRRAANGSLGSWHIMASQAFTNNAISDHVALNDPHTQYLRKDNALSGLTDNSGARTTLDVYSTGEVDSNISDAISTALFESDLEQNGGTIQENNVNSTVTGNRVFESSITSANSQGKILLNPNNDGSVGIWSTRVDSSGNFVWREENTNNTDHGYISTDGGFVIGTPTGNSQGSGSINAQTIYRNGEELDSRYFTQTQIDEKKANEYTEEVTVASGNTHTIAASSLPFTVSELRSLTVDLKVEDTESGSATQNMWIDGTAVLTYGVDTSNSQIVIVNEYNQSLNIFIRIIM